MSVVDASALVAYLFDPVEHAGLEHVLTEGAGPFWIPEICDLEVASTLRSLVLRGECGISEATETLALYRELPLERFDHLPLLDRIWALRDNLTPDDAAYVALAEALEAPFLTADARLADAVHRFTEVDAQVV